MDVLVYTMPSDASRPKQSESITEWCSFNITHTGTRRLDLGLQCYDCLGSGSYHHLWMLAGL